MLRQWTNKAKPLGNFSVLLFSGRISFYRNIMETGWVWQAMFAEDWR